MALSKRQREAIRLLEDLGYTVEFVRQGRGDHGIFRVSRNGVSIKTTIPAGGRWTSRNRQNFLRDMRLRLGG